METLLEINDFTLELNDTIILDKITLCFKKGISVFLSGTNGSGKTSLLQAVLNYEKYPAIISYAKICVILDSLYFFSSSVADEIKYLSLTKEQQQFVNLFFDADLLNSNPNKLNFYQQKIMLLCSKLYQNPALLFIDNVYSFLNSHDRKMFLDFYKKNSITLVLVSNDIELALSMDYMIIMDHGKVAIEGDTLPVLKQEKLLKRLGIGLPFYVDLSTQLQYYNLIQEEYFDAEKLGDVLWN